MRKVLLMAIVALVLQGCVSEYTEEISVVGTSLPKQVSSAASSLKSTDSKPEVAEKPLPGLLDGEKFSEYQISMTMDGDGISTDGLIYMTTPDAVYRLERMAVDQGIELYEFCYRYEGAGEGSHMTFRCETGSAKVYPLEVKPAVSGMPDRDGIYYHDLSQDSDEQGLIYGYTESNGYWLCMEMRCDGRQLIDNVITQFRRIADKFSAKSNPYARSMLPKVLLHCDTFDYTVNVKAWPESFYNLNAQTQILAVGHGDAYTKISLSGTKFVGYDEKIELGDLVLYADTNMSEEDRKTALCPCNFEVREKADDSK